MNNVISPDNIDEGSLTLSSTHSMQVSLEAVRSGHEDILFHGGRVQCHITGILWDSLTNHRLELVGHSHPGEEVPEPSLGDRIALRKIKQKISVIISARTGISVEFGSDRFELRR